MRAEEALLALHKRLRHCTSAAIGCVVLVQILADEVTACDKPASTAILYSNLATSAYHTVHDIQCRTLLH